MGVLLALAAAAVVVASAQAAPIKKKYDAYVVAANPSSTSFKLTLVNDALSQQTLGSANFSAPGLSIASIPLTTFTTTDGHHWSVCTGSGGVACGDGANNVVELRSASAGDALLPGQSVSVTADANATGCTNALWVTAAKQSNDFSGSNNLFTLAAHDLTPLGSFAIAPIETVLTTGSHVPQILVNKVAPISVTAKDTCGNVDTDYSGGSPYSGATFAAVSGLANATFSGPSWSNGVGSASAKPVDVEVGDQFSLTDATTGISATSSSTEGKTTFDVVETICAAGDSCTWKDKNNPITATSTVPNDNGKALGLGYRPFAAGATCTPEGGNPKPPVGDSIYIDPWKYDSPYTIVLTYGKSILPNAPASDFIVCKSPDNGQTWDATQIPPCPKTPVAPCAAAVKVSGGNLQVTLYLNPGDPHSGGFSP
ncbi:MAG: hypothetical protein ACJ75G_00390 [Gaiellaceae bacterium]